MPRKPLESKKITKPLIPIDWKKADDLLTAGCHGTEVASYFGMHPETFYDRVKIEKGIGFTEYSSKKKSHGEALIRAQQFKKALGQTEEGDNTLLIWLGKTRLKQELQDLQIKLDMELEKDKKKIQFEHDLKISAEQKPVMTDTVNLQNENMILKAKLAAYEEKMNVHNKS